MHTTTRQILVSAMAVPLVMGAAAPATAWSKYMSKDSGSYAYVQWTEYGELGGGVGGNVHVGFLDVRSGQRSLDSFVYVEDYDCEEGEFPGGGGHGEEPPLEGACDLVSVRDFYGNESSLTLNVSKKLGSATLTGSYLSGGGHGGPGTGPGPSVNLTLTGVGGIYSSTWKDSYTDEGVRYTSTYTDTGRQGTVSGTIGAMGFDDDVDDEAYGQFGTFKSTTRESTR